MTTRRTKIFHALLHCPIHVGFKRQEPPTKNLYPSRYSSGRPHLWQDPFHYLTQAPLESITKTYFTALQLYLAPPLINQQIVNPPTQKKKTRKDLDTLWLKMQEPDYTSRNSTKKKKVGLSKTFIERASANTRTGPHCHLTLLKPSFSESSN
jgi:hypothetical protein